MNKTDQILNDTSHRQYPIPIKKWKYQQQWHKTLFVHWEVPAYFLQQYIPKGLQLDTFNTNVRVSLVAFEVKKMRLRDLSSVPFISNFHEINILTYVIKDGRPVSAYGFIAFR